MATDWMPTTMEGKLTMFTNVLSKVGNYELILPLTAALVTEIEEICANFINSFDFVEESRATRQAVTSWRDNLLYGEPVGDPLPAAPVFTNIGAVTGKIGIIPRFRQIRELIVASPGYTEAIGEDLMIVGNAEGPVPEANNVPELKLTVLPGYQVSLKASLKGNDQLRVEYKRNGSDEWVLLDLLTSTPATLTISPQTPGQPESGQIRAIFRQEKANVGSILRSTE